MPLYNSPVKLTCVLLVSLKLTKIMQSLTLTGPDDWHFHLRDGDVISNTVADSAPHARNAKENACGCVGDYSTPAAIELYT